MDDDFGQRRIIAHLLLIQAKSGHPGRLEPGGQMRPPTAHQVENCAPRRDPLRIDFPDRRDSWIVNMDDPPRPSIELLIFRLVDATEESGLDGVGHSCSCCRVSRKKLAKSTIGGKQGGRQTPLTWFRQLI